MNSQVNKRLNSRLEELYANNNDAFVKLHNDYYDDKLPRINEFGIIDENVYDAENGILIIGKETNWWDDVDFHENILFRTWIRDISRTGLPQELQANGKKHHITRHPQMWYNIGRWISYCDQIIKNQNWAFDDILAKPHCDLIKEIGKCAFTNVNKGRGYETSRDMFWELVQHNELPKHIIEQEINVIQPRIVIFCGVACLFDALVQRDKARVYLDLPHPAARKKTQLFLEEIKNQLNAHKHHL